MVLWRENTVTADLSNRTRQSWSQSGPMPNKLWWKFGMMWPAVVGSCERRMSHAADEWWGAPPAVPTTTLTAFGFMLAHGAFGVR